MVMKKNLFNSGLPYPGVNESSAVSIEKLSKNDIAVIGMAGRLPLAENMQEFWNNIANGKDCIIDFPQLRADEIKRYYNFKNIKQPETGLKFKRKGYLANVDKFDYKFFKLTAKEAAVMNPAQRIFLQTAYHAIENAGYACSKLNGSQTGIYLGYTGGSGDYFDLVKEVEPEFGIMAYPANLPSIIASRISYLFNFKGPSLLIDTACSSSMVAFEAACQAIRLGSCDMAIAGGINLSWMPLEEDSKGLGILSSSGKTKTFDDTSDGTVGGEGCIAILLKPLNMALRDNDHILAVVKGIASNQDGASIGITAPNALAQADVIDRAWRDGKIDPETISFIEAHGTGTELGDPIEIEGITKAFSKHTDKKQFCAISAVKTNIGHLNSVAGVAGIAKAVLSLENKKLPPLLHFEKPNSKINFEESPVFINSSLTDWKTDNGVKRRCGVSSFGMSGTNCHLVLEEAPKPAEKSYNHIEYLFALSAKSKKAVKELADSYMPFLESISADIDIEDICFTATVGRDHHDHRVAFVTNSVNDLKQKMALFQRNDWDELKSEGIFYNCLSKSDEHINDQQVLIEKITAQCTTIFADQPAISDNSLLEKAALLYVQGADVEWEKLYAGKTPRRAALPLYPFEQKRCWVTYPEYNQLEGEQAISLNNQVQKSVREMNINKNFTDDQPELLQKNSDQTEPSELLQTINMQLQIMAKQLEMVNNFCEVYNEDEAEGDDKMIAEETFVNIIPPVVSNQVHVSPDKQQPITNTQPEEIKLTEAQKKYVDELIASFNKKTKTSKKLVQQKRQYYANNRLVAGYTQTYKEMMYPILVDEAVGSALTDVDGNKYVDFCMGFGVYLLGYTHPAVSKGIEEQLKKGSYLGPMSPLPGEVAQLICEMTGVDRVAFYNSGTEAVMLALRLARAATSRTKIVMFSGSYHGTYDGVLAQPDKFSKEFKAVPKSTGIPQSILDEVILLDYGTPQSLEIIKQHAHELAAVLVEPVQSRRPEFQPKEYLLELRAITEELKVPLIFDEIITGFRIHPGGAQAWFGIKADLVTYGKIPGGGMPIGIIGGKAEFMHGVDGGMWQFGDDSHPKFDHRKTFVAGTFCHHPVSMAAAKAALLHLKAKGPELQDTLNRKTNEMAQVLNDYFEHEKFDVKIVNFGSLFQIRTNYDLSLIVYHFLNSGIYAWEGMTFFISEAHSKQDIDFLISVFKTTLQKLRSEGFISTPPDLIEKGKFDLQKITAPEPAFIPLTEEQRRLWFTATASENASVAFNSTRVITVEEALDEVAFSSAVQKMLQRHEVLRSVAINGDCLILSDQLKYDVLYISIDSNNLAAADKLIQKEKRQPFNFAKGPFFRIKVLKEGTSRFSVIFVIHHIIADGWSVNLILDEIAALYFSECGKTKINLPAPTSFRQYINWIDSNYTSPQSEDSKRYWIKQLSKNPERLLQPAYVFKENVGTYNGSSFVLKLNSNITTSLNDIAKKENCTLFMVLLSLYNVFLNKIFSSNKLILGIPSAGQLNMEAESLVGCCVQLLPYFVEINEEQAFDEFISLTKKEWMELYRNRNYPYGKLSRDEDYNIPEIDITFNMDAPSNIITGNKSDNDNGSIYKKEADFNKYNLFLNCVKIGDELKFTFQYNSLIFKDEMMVKWVSGFETMVKNVVPNPGIKIADIQIADSNRTVEKPEADSLNNDYNILKNFWSTEVNHKAEDVLVKCNNKEITNAQLKRRAGNLAFNIKNKGFKKNDIVVIALSNYDEMFYTVFGLLQCGLKYILLPGIGKEALNELYKTQQFKAVISSNDGLYQNSGQEYCTLEYKKLIVNKSFRLDSICFEPVCANAFECKTDYYQSIISAFDLTAIDQVNIVSEQLDVNFICDIVLLAILSNKKIGFYNNVVQFENLTEGQNSSVLVMHKALWADWIKNSENVQVNQVVIGDVPLLGDQVDLWLKSEKRKNLYYGYFSNEAQKLICSFKVNSGQEKLVLLSIGKPLDNCKILLTNKHFQALPIGVFGKLYIEVEGDTFNVGTNTINNDKNYVKISDNARLLSDGNIELNLLADSEEGKKLHSAVLQETIKTIKNVKNVLIKAAQSVGSKTELIAYISFYANNNSNLYEVEEHLKKHFISEFLPSAYVITDNPLLEKCNVDKEPVLKNSDSEMISEHEMKVLDIFRSVLKYKGLGVNDNFFESGGNSLRAIQIISKIHKALNVKLQLNKIFTHPTVRDLANIIKHAANDTYKKIEPVAKQLYYNLSHAQKRLWILDQVQKGQTAYLISKSYLIEGDFSVLYFNKALEALIERHESLRTNFLTVNGEAKQKINDFEQGIYSLNFIDIRNDENKDDVLKCSVDKEIETPIDLAKDNLLRVKVIQLDEFKYAISLTLHHIIADGWSMEIIVNDIISLYNAFKNKQLNPLIPFEIQYKDYVSWQDNLLNSPQIEIHKNYWHNLFKEGVPVIDLPTDYVRPLVKTANGDKVYFKFDKDISAKIYAISKNCGTSTFTTLLAITKALLYKYTAQTDIIIGSTTAGRDDAELENQVGIYANTLIFKTQFNESEGFEQLLTKVKEVTLSAYEHQLYPFDKIVEDLDIQRDLSRAPVFDVMIELDDIDVEFEKSEEIEDVTLSHYDKEVLSSKYDLTFRYNAEETIFGAIEFNTDLFNKGTVEQMAEHLRQIIIAVDANFNIPLQSLQFLNHGEESQLLNAFNDTQNVNPLAQTIQQGFETTAKTYFHHIAVHSDEVSLTYQQLNEKANALAAYLADNYQIGPNKKVGILANRSDRIITALLGVLKSGAAFVPISPELPKERIDYILADAGIELLITDSDFMFDFADNSTLTLFVLDIELDGLMDIEHNNLPKASESDLAYIIYTSGSTGLPKGVEVERRNLANYINWANDYYFGNQAGKTFAFFTSLAFDLTITSIFSTLLRGDKIWVMENKDINETLKKIFTPDSEIDVVKMTPSHVRLLGCLGIQKTNVSQIILGGEALTSEHIQILRRLNEHIRIFNEYGPTEATVGCIVKEISNHNELVLIGKPIYNTQIYILDKYLNLLPNGVAGEIYIGGDSVARGYTNNEILTAERFIDNPFLKNKKLYKSGDRARWLNNGEIEYLGRNDDQVKINGYRIELNEIEAVLLTYPSLQQVLVTVVMDNEQNPLLAAYFVSDTQLGADELIPFLRITLPHYMVPSFFIQLTALPLTVNGKINKKELPDPLKAGGINKRLFVAPADDIQKRLAIIWEKTFSIDAVGIKDNFFELGGHSLKATQIILEIFKEFGVNIDLDEIFTRPTIEELSTKISATEQSIYYNILPVKKQKYYDVSHAQKRIWILNLLEDNQTAYIIPDAFLLKGDLNQHAFKNAFTTLVKRHESLRTTFVSIDDELKQQVHEFEDFPFEVDYQDLRSAADAWKLVKAEVQVERNLSFDLDKGPLIRARLLRVEDASHVFLLTVHHIISDGWSFEVLIKEVTQLYRMFSEGSENSLPPLSIQYKEYSNWQLEYLSGERLIEHKNFWSDYLGGATKLIEIPTDYHRKPQRTYNGDTLRFRLDETLTKKVKQLSQRNAGSVFMTLAAAINILLYRYTREKDVIIGFPIAGRSHKDLENQIGLYLNTLALRINLDTGETIEDLLKRVKQATLNIYKYQLYSFDLIIEDLNIERKPNRSPLFDIGITWQNQMEMNISGEVNFKGLTISQLEEDCIVAKHDIWFYGSEIDDCLDFRLRYNTDLYKPETISKIKEDFVKICEKITGNPHSTLNDLVISLIDNHNVSETLTVINSNISEDF